MSGAASTATTHRIKLACRYSFSGGVPCRSFWVALAVGTVLNLINQGDHLLTHQPLDLAKLALTYLVPYFVATYGAVSFRFQAERGARPRNG